MKKRMIRVACALAAMQLLAGNPGQSGMLTASAQEGQKEVLQETDVFAEQKAVDEALKAELDNGYSFEEPIVIVNPYGTSPLSAVVIFTTEESLGGTVTVKGKAEENDITGEFEASQQHIVPVYGLYSGDVTEVVLTLEDGRKTSLEVETEALSVNYGTIEVQMLDDTAYDYSELTFFCALGGGVYATDAAGDIRWYYADCGNLGVHPLENGHLMMPTAFTLKTSYYKSGLKEIDLTGKVYREYAIPGGMHHDFREMPNGNLLVAGDHPDLSSVEDYVAEIDRTTGEVVWELDMKEVLEIKDGESASMNSDGSEEADWYHNNSVWYDEENDLVLMSARHKDAIVAVNKSDKTLAWILGDPTGWETVDESYFFTPVGENFEWQYAQHEVTMLDNGDIMMFDNGTAKVKRIDDANRVTGDDVYSRAVIYRIDTENMTIEQVFEYGKERGAEWYSDWVSGVESLDGTQDNLWITAGSHLYNPEEDSHDYGPTGMFLPGLIKSTHVDQVKNGELVYEMVVSGESFTSLTFRTFRYCPYTQSAQQDVDSQGEILGNLGETAYTDLTVSFDNVQKISDGWTVTLDEIKLYAAGSYQTGNDSAALQPAYLILRGDGEVRAYELSQNGAEGEDGTNVSASGWVSPVGLEGRNWDIYLQLDGEIYETGYSVEL